MALRSVFMSSFSVVLIVVCCVTVSSVCGSYSGRLPCKHERLGLAEALEAAERSAGYFEDYYSKMNIDGIFGLRAAEGYLYKIVSQVDREQLDYSSLRLYNRLAELYKLLEELGSESLPYLKQQNTAYYNTFTFLVKTKFQFQRSFRRADLSLLFKGDAVSNVLNETFSDSCMSGLLGSSASGEKRLKCQISDICMQKMGNSSGEGYVVTHQALFLILGIAAGCKTSLIEKFGGSEKLEHRMDVLGSNIYADLLKNSKDQKTKRDLFLEQSLVCYMLGIVDCMQLSWLEAGVSWQDKSGGYGPRKYTDPWLVDALGKRRIEYSQKKSTFKRHSRSLMASVSLPDGGSAHPSGLGLSFAAIYLHWIISPPDYEGLGMKSPLPVTHCPLGLTHSRP